MDIDTLVQEKIDADVDFQLEIESLDDTEREEAINTKRSEVLSNEFASLKEKADKADKAEELANNYKIRAEKAEGKKGDTTPKNKVDTDLSPRDLYALMNAKVDQEDVEEVVKAAKLLGKTVQEALNDETVKVILRTREGHRKTAEATSTKSVRPGSKAVSVNEIVQKASKGEFPEKGSTEAEDLFWARRGGKR